jgi:hypothetical protein
MKAEGQLRDIYPPQEPPVPTDGGWVGRRISLDAVGKKRNAPSLSQIPICPTLQNCWSPFFVTYEYQLHLRTEAKTIKKQNYCNW